MLESLFNKFAGLQISIFLKRISIFSSSETLARKRQVEKVEGPGNIE